jgi:hypothetical protein
VRRASIFLVALLVVLAGCGTTGTGGENGTAATDVTPTPGSTAADGTSTGGDDSASTTADDSSSTTGDDSTAAGDETASPTATQTAGDGETVENANTVPGVEDGTVNTTKLVGAYLNRIFTGHSAFEMVIKNGSQNLTYSFTNDTERQLYELDNSERGVTSYYVTNGTDGVRNTTTGEIRYGEGDSSIQTSARFTVFLALAGTNYIKILDWDVTGTKTIDGETYYVLESSSLNESALNSADSDFGISPSEVTAVDGSLTVSEDGVIRTGSVLIESADNTIEITYSLRTGDGITVSEPGWFDDS